ncbi:MAG: ParB/RepB/Spo0J family partition protein [Bacteroidales bacterium]|nr:ParB/RepB/Spo0J family partition protein [Bacteroidales bacterium]
MQKKNGGLGRGLGAILTDIEIDGVQSSGVTAITSIPIDKIGANPFQPRKEFDEQALADLAQSIKHQGVITPVTVRKMPDGTYQLVAGERRLRASKMAGLTELPAYVRTATDMQMMEMALVENVQRENLNAIEVALAYKALVEECNLTHDQLSEKVGKNRSTITNYLRLLSLPAEVQLALSAEKISMAHARALISVEDVDEQLAILHEIIERQLSVHQTEQRVKDLKKEPKQIKQKSNSLPPQFKEKEEMLKQKLQSVVEIKRTQRGKGSVTIMFNSDNDFSRIMSLLEKE